MRSAILAAAGGIVGGILLLAVFLSVAPPEQISRDFTTCVYKGDPDTLTVESCGTIDIDGTLDISGGTLTSGTGQVTAAMVADTVRGVNIPLLSFIECETNGGAAIDFDSGADAFPDFVGLATDGLGFSLTFDDTGGSPDTAEVCSQIIVPQDYASGGALRLRISKDAETGANDEFINSQVSINGGALGDASATEVTTSTLSAYTITPAGTYTAGSTVGVMLSITSTGTMDDAVLLHGLEWYYTSSQ